MSYECYAVQCVYDGFGGRDEKRIDGGNSSGERKVLVDHIRE